MKIGLIEVSHFHARMVIDALKEIQANVIAVSDRNVDIAKNVADEMGCNCYTDYTKLVTAEKPDFVFTFGRHFEMPAIAKLLIDRHIDFSIEKPVGVKLQQVDELRKMVEEKGVYVAVPFHFRNAPWAQRVAELKEEGKLGKPVHLYFRYIAGPPSRYIKFRCEWMLNKEQAGGGCTINLGIHFTDLFRYLTGSEITRVFARMSNTLYKLEIEDFSTLVLESGDGASAVIETGYAHPISTEHPFTTADWHYYIVTPDNYFVVNEDFMRHRSEEGENLLPNPSGGLQNIYKELAKDTLRRFQTGTPPVAGLKEVVSSLKVINKAYESNLTRMPVEI